jgi:NhaP-type Na+/H+ or K+/H+ antiporter
MLKEYSALIIFSIALLTFGLAESVGGSGMLAVAVSGFIVGNLGFPHKEKVSEFQNELSDMLRISVFTMLGAQIFLDPNPLLLLVEFLFAIFVFVIRPIFVTYLAKDFEGEVGYEGFTLLKLMGPRGISAAAMAPIAAVALGDGRIMNLVFMVIFFSVLMSSVVAKLVSSGKAVTIKEKVDSVKDVLKGKGKDKEETAEERDELA